MIIKRFVLAMDYTLFNNCLIFMKDFVKLWFSQFYKTSVPFKLFF